jgi:hypothetical protein
VSGIGQADDVALLSNDLHALQGLLDLSLYNCKKYHVSLSSEKTKLQVFCAKSSEDAAFIGRATSILNISGHPVQFETEAEHVGIVRSTTGNLPHLLSRFAAHRSSLFKVLPVGAGKGHRGNPAACINAHQTYCYPVLFSGIPSLVLTNSEINILDQFFKVSLQRLQKLRDKTPDCVVMFLAGQLPGKAVLHLRLLSTFGMICRLPESFLHKIAEYQLTSAKQSSGSWFLQIRDICLMYNLPSPITFLQNTPTKYVYKKLVKSKVVDYWELNLQAEAENLKENSLKYFQADFMSLTTPHLIWSTCGSNPYEVHKAVIQAKMLSGRYVTDKLSRYWTQNKAGICSIPTCTGQDIGSLEHLLLFCPAFSDARERMVELWQAVASEHQEPHSIIYSVLSGQTVETFVQFLLDCSCFPAVIRLKQNSGLQLVSRLFYLTCSWCHSMHRSRMNKLGLLQYR